MSIRTPWMQNSPRTQNSPPPTAVSQPPPHGNSPPKDSSQLPPGFVKTPWGTIEQVSPLPKVNDVAKPPPGVATSSGPPSPGEKPSVIRTPEGTAVIDYFHHQPPPVDVARPSPGVSTQVPTQPQASSEAARLPPSKSRLPIEIESTIYIPRVLEKGKSLNLRIESSPSHIQPFLEEWVKAHKPEIESTVYIPPFLEVLGIAGGSIEQEMPEVRKSRGRRPLSA